jgi:hypothetical protein
MRNHYINTAPKSKTGKPINPTKSKAHVTHRRISNKRLEIDLTQTKKTTIKSPKKSKRKKITSIRKKRRAKKRKTIKTIAPKLKKDPSKNHRTRDRRFYMGLRKPQMNPIHRKLNKENEKDKKPPKLTKTVKKKEFRQKNGILQKN